MYIPTLFAALLAAPAALAQFVPPPRGFRNAKGAAGINVRYKEVPTGICETTEGVRSYTGYADVAQDQHLFFWFFEAREADPLKAPLTVWINGGPGSSSMIGLWQELGPCGVYYNGSLYNNPYSWNRKSNMLFVDEPTQVGFSYSYPVNGYMEESGQIITLPDNTCPDYAQGACGTFSYPNASLTANTTEGAAPNFWKLLQGFMGAFPQYSRGGFHFTTESYGGHYAPVFNEYFEEQNDANIPGALKINLKSVAIGNGWYDPYIQYQAYYNYTVYPGNTYDYKPYNKTVQDRIYNALYGKGNCLDQIKDCNARGLDDICSIADAMCAAEIENPLDVIANRDEYDIRELMPDPFPYSFYGDYLNTPRVQKAIGAYVNWTSFSLVTGNAFANTGDDGRESMTVEDIRKLLARGVSVTLYAGDADYNCNWLGNEAVANEVQAQGFASAGYANIATSDGIVHGVVKQAGQFSFARIYNAGHEVPFYQPVVSLALFERSIAGTDIATGTTKVSAGYKTRGPARSTYREGPKTIQNRVLPECATYNTQTNAPNPVANCAPKIKKRHQPWRPRDRTRKLAEKWEAEKAKRATQSNEQ